MMKLGQALEACKAGLKIARKSWNGKDQFVYWSPPIRITVEQVPNPVLRAWLEHHKGVGDEVEFWGHVDFKPTNNKIQCGWLATQSDMQADDWEIVA
ncbi:MAG: DUF2829 domain-containing protein [Treponema sp.]|jgi:hypothetical protein|nr:DUF2829 domain-containing protein [Treponema sp.]